MVYRASNQAGCPPQNKRTAATGGPFVGRRSELRSEVDHLHHPEARVGDVVAPAPRVRQSRTCRNPTGAQGLLDARRKSGILLAEL